MPVRRWDKSKQPLGPFALNRDCPQAQGLVAWFPMGGQGGSKVFLGDFAGKIHGTGTANSATRLRSGAPGLLFNGSSDVFTLTQSTITATPISLHVWAQITTPGTTQCLMGVGNSGTPDYQEPASLLCVASKPWALSQSAGSNNVQSQGATTLSAGVLYGIGGVWASDSSRRVYLNGVADAAAETTTRSPTGVNMIRFGRRANNLDTQYFGGVLGEACVWNIAVSADTLLRINDPGTRFELWYPLRSKKWFVQGGGTTHNADLTETASLTDAVSVTLTAAASLTETVSLTDTVSAILSAVADLTETASLTDTADATNTAIADLTETLSLTDSVSSVIGLTADLTETASLADSSSADLLLGAVVEESLTLTDTASAIATLAAVVEETLSLADVASCIATILADLTETASLTDAVDGTTTALTADLTETITLADSASAGFTRAAALTETASLTDSVSVSATFAAAVSEALTLLDTIVGASIRPASLTETLSLVDTIVATLNNATTPLERVLLRSRITQAILERSRVSLHLKLRGKLRH